MRLDHAYQIIKGHGIPPDSPLTELLHGIWYMMRCRSALVPLDRHVPSPVHQHGGGRGRGLMRASGMTGPDGGSWSCYPLSCPSM